MSSVASPASPAAPPPAPPAAALPEFHRKTWLYKLGQSFFRFAALTGFDLKTQGIGNIPRRGGVLIVANHQSFLDPIMLAVNIPRAVSFLAKSELFENKYFGRLIRGVNAFPVRQGEGDVGAVRETIKRLQEGHVLIMFPEGGRSEDGKLAPMEKGVGLIIRRAGPAVKVVPAAIDGAFEAWSRHRKFPRCNTIRVKYGPALSLAEMKATQIVQTIDREIHSLFGDIRGKRK
jgi:1-acyl-sn-glycerol-3-phosphate acyltransferase